MSFDRPTFTSFWPGNVYSVMYGSALTQLQQYHMIQDPTNQ